MSTERERAADQPHRWSESSGVAGVCGKRKDKSSSSKWLPVLLTTLHLARTCFWEKVGSYSPWVWEKIVLNTYDGLSDYTFSATVIYSWEVAQMRLSNCLCGRNRLATGQRKTDFIFFLGDALSPKCNCFVTHFFHSLKVEKFLAAITVELAKDIVSSTACQMNLMRQILGGCKQVQLHWQWCSKTGLHLKRIRPNMF